jgi:hypothetical protein
MDVLQFLPLFALRVPHEALRSDDMNTLAAT